MIDHYSYTFIFHNILDNTVYIKNINDENNLIRIHLAFI
jgi:hypothetical protein